VVSAFASGFGQTARGHEPGVGVEPACVRRIVRLAGDPKRAADEIAQSRPCRRRPDEDYPGVTQAAPPQ